MKETNVFIACYFTLNKMNNKLKCNNCSPHDNYTKRFFLFNQLNFIDILVYDIFIYRQ